MRFSISAARAACVRAARVAAVLGGVLVVLAPDADACHCKRVARPAATCTAAVAPTAYAVPVVSMPTAPAAGSNCAGGACPLIRR